MPSRLEVTMVVLWLLSLGFYGVCGGVVPLHDATAFVMVAHRQICHVGDS